MVRPAEDHVRGAKLHQPTEIQHGDAVGQVAHDAEIVRDDDVAGLLVALQVAQQVEDRGLHRHVERTGGFVADHDARAAGKGTGDRNALLEAAGQCTRTHVEVARRQPDLFGERREPHVGVLAADTGELAERALEDGAYRLRAVKRRIGVLEDDLDCATRIGLAPRRKTSQLLAVELDHRARVGGMNTENCLGERRLARAGLADEAKRLAGTQVEIDVDQSTHLVTALLERLGHVLEVQYHVANARTGDRCCQRRGDERADLAGVVAVDRASLDGMRGRRHNRAALIGGERTAVLEHTCRQLGADQRQRAGDRVEAALGLVGPTTGQAAEQADGVGMLRVVEDLGRRALLDDLAGVHHADAIADAAHHTEVVGDQQDGSTGLFAQRRHEVEHLGLHRRVEARGGLVENQQLRIAGQRHRDHDALLHTARQLVRIAIEDALGVGNAHAIECLNGLDLGLVLREAEDRECLDDLLADLDRRVQRLARILIDHGDAAGAKIAQTGRREVEHVLAGDRDRATRDMTVLGQIADGRVGRRGLATARLADQAVRLARLDLEGDTAKHGARDATHVVGDVELLELEGGGVVARFGGAHSSITSCRRSAIRLTAITRLAIAAAGKTVTHQ